MRYRKRRCASATSGSAAERKSPAWCPTETPVAPLVSRGRSWKRKAWKPDGVELLPAAIQWATSSVLGALACGVERSWGVETAGSEGVEWNEMTRNRIAARARKGNRTLGSRRMSRVLPLLSHYGLRHRTACRSSVAEGLL